jgi:hypothetical protein
VIQSSVIRENVTNYYKTLTWAPAASQVGFQVMCAMAINRYVVSLTNDTTRDEDLFRIVKILNHLSITSSSMLHKMEPIVVRVIQQPHRRPQHPRKPWSRSKITLSGPRAPQRQLRESRQGSHQSARKSSTLLLRTTTATTSTYVKAQDRFHLI